jgi:hypothetical protein
VEAAIPREKIFITKTVKHFKYEQRSGRRAKARVTIHPSLLLRLRDAASKEAEYHRLVGDLQAAAKPAG